MYIGMIREKEETRVQLCNCVHALHDTFMDRKNYYNFRVCIKMFPPKTRADGHGAVCL